MKRRARLYTSFERFWHWALTALVLALFLTGLEVHGSVRVIGFGQAIHWHDRLGWALVVLVALTIFYHLTSGQWRQYLPLRSGVREMVGYYTGGIFRGDPHPFKRSEVSKLNPLQRLTYLGLKLVLFPVQMVSGFLYYFYNDWAALGLKLKLETVALVHTAGTYLLLGFVIAHVYLITTGRTPLSNLKAMVTGWEELED